MSATAAQAIEHDDRHAFVTGSQHLSTGAEWRLPISIVVIEALSAFRQDADAEALASGVAATESSVSIARINRTTPRLCEISRRCPAQHLLPTIVDIVSRIAPRKRRRELALRYSDTNLNYHAGSRGFAPAADAVRGGDQRILTAGANWYLNSIMRIMLDYQYVRISRLSPNAALFLTPVGAEIGQNYSAIAGRVQLAF